MPIYRFFQSGPLSRNIKLEGTEHKHLSQVLRLKEGDEAEVFNGQGSLALCSIASLEKKSTELKILENTTATKPSPLILALAFIRVNRLDTVVEKVTELGITELRLFPGDKSEKEGLSRQQSLRLEQIFISACKQSGNLWLPDLKLYPPISEWTPELNLWYGSLDPSAPSLLKSPEASTICIGPESGFSEKEIRELTKLGGHPCRLHPNTLRSDTAAIISVGMLAALRT